MGGGGMSGEVVGRSLQVREMSGRAMGRSRPTGGWDWAGEGIGLAGKEDRIGQATFGLPLRTDGRAWIVRGWGGLWSLNCDAVRHVATKTRRAACG